MGFYTVTKRKSISKKKRFDVFKRDSFTCQYCGGTPPSVVLHVDHIDPVANGGMNDDENLITSCSACNLGKGASLLSDIPRSLKDRACEIKEREEQIAGYNAVLMGKRDRIELESWEVVEALEGSEVDSYNKKKLTSIKTFLNRLPLAEVLDAADRTNSKFHNINSGAFRYFCGICWGKIKSGEDWHA